MGFFYDEIPDDPKLLEWIKGQCLFHVATAPLKGELHIHVRYVSASQRHAIIGHYVNVSPKGQQTFKLMNRKACWYLDLTGSGRYFTPSPSFVLRHSLKLMRFGRKRNNLTPLRTG